MLTVATLLVSFIRQLRTCSAALRELVDVTDDIQDLDWEVGGQCADGCVRQLVDAVASVSGEIDCDLRVQNLLDHTKEDVVGGMLNVVHSCMDSSGNAVYQVGVDLCFEISDGSRQKSKYSRTSYECAFLKFGSFQTIHEGV